MFTAAILEVGNTFDIFRKRTRPRQHPLVRRLTSDLLWSCGIQALKFMPKVPVTPDTVAKHSIAQLTTRFSDTISLRLRSTQVSIDT